MRTNPATQMDGRMKRIIALGGGCYGLLHVTHLLKARARGRIAFDQIVVVDRNRNHQVRRHWGEHPAIVYVHDTWESFLYQYGRAGVIRSDDEIVMPCIGPHLMLIWMMERINRDTPHQAELVPWDRQVGIPVEISTPAGTHAVSYAMWRCPPTCIEPPLCPVIRGPKDWDVGTFVERHHRQWGVGGRRIDHCEVFVSRHRVWGVATIPAVRLLEAWNRLERFWQRSEGDGFRVLVATVSSCHGLLGLLHVRPASR